MLEIYKGGVEDAGACYCSCGCGCGCTCICSDQPSSQSEQINIKESAHEGAAGTLAIATKNQDLFR